MANTRELAQFASFVDFTGTSIGFSTQFNVSGVSTFTNTVIFDSTGSIQIPKGTTGQRLSGVLGQIRYNTSLSQFEGYGAGNAWGSLGGVKDVDGDTFIRAESAAGEDEDVLEFLTGNSTRLVIDSTGKVGIGSTLPTAKLDVNGTLNVSGVSTFQDNVHLGDNDVLKFGDHEVFEIYSTGTSSIIKETGSGNLKILGNNILLKNAADSTTYADFNNGGSVELYYNNSKKFETTNTGAVVTGILTATSFSGSGASLTSIPNSSLSNSSVSFGGVSVSLGGSDDTPAFDLQHATNYPTSSLSGTITNAQLAGSIANDKLAGSIANNKLANSSVSFGGVSVALGAADATPAFNLQDATGYPFTSLTGITTDIFGDTTPTLGGNLDANSKDITGINNINVSGASTFSGPISVGDNIQLKIGTSDDLAIYHDGTNTWIDNAQGDLYIRSDGAGGDDIIIRANDDVIIQVAQAEDAIIARGDGEVELYYNNSKKFETTGIGVSISSGAGLTATIAGPPNLVLDPGTVGDNTGNVRIKGDLFVDGTTTQINSTALEIADFIVGIATTATSDALADGAGIQIGPSGNTFLYDNTNEAFTSTENLNVVSGHTYKIAGTNVLSATTLGSGVVNSSLTSLGTIATGVWQGTAINDTYIDTIDNANKVSLSALNIDGGTDIGAAIADADLFIIDDGAGGTNRKTAASRIKTYISDVTLTTASQTNITGVGTLSALSVSGNISIGSTTNIVRKVTDINSWVIKDTTFSVSAQQTQPFAVYFKPDGTKMFITGAQSPRDVEEYALSSAWDITSASHTTAYSVNSQDTSPQGLFFSPNGENMFIVGATNDNVYHYTLSTGWDLTSTVTYVGNFDISSQDTVPAGLTFGDSGTKMYVVGRTNDNIYQYNLSSAYTITSGVSLANTLDIGATSTIVTNGFANPHGISISSDGTKIWIVGTGEDRISQINLSTAYDLSTASYNSDLVGIGWYTTTPNDLYINESAGKAFVVDSGGDDVHEIDITTSGLLIEANPTVASANINLNNNVQIKGETWFDDRIIVNGPGTSWFQHNVQIQGNLTCRGVVDLHDGNADRIQFGASDDAKIYYDGTDNFFDLVFSSADNNGLRILDSSESELLRVTNDGKVGIGTDNPNTKLHIYDTAPIIRLTDSDQAADNRHWNITAGQTQLLRIQALNDSQSGGGNLFEFYRSGSNIQEFHGVKSGITWFVLDNLNAQVGIGTNDPKELLDVYSSGDSTISVRSGNGDLSSIGLVESGNNSFGNLNSYGFRLGYDGNTNKFKIDSGYVDSNYNLINTRLVISRDNGNVGIGTDNPTAKLEVATSVAGIATVARFKNTSGGGTDQTADIELSLENVTTSNVILRAGKEANHSSGAATDNFFAVHTTLDNTSSEKLRITSAGNIGVNTTTFAANGTNFKVSDGTISRLALDKTGANARQFEIGNFGTGLNVYDVTADEERLRIDSDGKVGIDQTNPQGDLHIGNITGNKDLIMHSVNNGTARLRFREGGSTASGFNEYSIGMVGNRNAVTVNGQGAGEIIAIMGDTGKVGIGTEIPSTMLEVGNQSQTLAGAITVSNGEIIGGGTGPVINLKHGPAGGTQRTHQIYSYIGDLRIVADSNENMEFHTGGSESLRIESGGNVRIIKEHLRFDTTGKGIIFGINGGSNRPSIFGNYTSSSDNNMVFNVTGEERIQIQSNGQILFKGTSGDNQFTSRRTNVAGSAGDYFFHLNAQNRTPTTVGSLGFHQDGAEDSSRFVISTKNTGGSLTERLRITSAGDLQRPKSLSQEVSTSVSSVSATSCGSFAKATYRSAYVIAQITQGSSYQVGRYLVIHDGTTATTIEESAIATGDMLGTFSGVVSGSNVEFRVTMSSASSATVITKIESIVV